MELDIKKLLLLQANECLSMNELCEKAEISRSTLSKIIHCKRNTNPKTIGLLARALKVEVIELLLESKNNRN